MDWFVCLFCFLNCGSEQHISYCFVWLLQNTINFPYRMGSLKSWVNDLFPKERCCFWRWKFSWHTSEIQCHWNYLMQDWQCSAVMRSCKISGLEVSHALHFGTQYSVQPVWKPGASCFQSAQTPGCAVSGKNPVRLFHQTRWSFAVSAVLHIPRVVMGGFFTNIPVNLVFLHGLEVPCVKFGFQTPALSHSYPYDQQMELREYYFLEVKEIISPWFSWLELEWYIFPCVSFPFSY